jgi:hypothetical protein
VSKQRYQGNTPVLPTLNSMRFLEKFAGIPHRAMEQPKVAHQLGNSEPVARVAVEVFGDLLVGRYVAFACLDQRLSHPQWSKGLNRHLTKVPMAISSTVALAWVKALFCIVYMVTPYYS